MKLKKLISLLLVGTMSLSLITTVFSEELTQIALGTFAADTEGWIGNVNNNATIPNNANYVNTVDHTGDGSGSLEFSLYHSSPSFITQFGQHAYLGVGKKLADFTGVTLEAGKKYRVSAYIKNHDTRYTADKPFYLGITKANDKDGSDGSNIFASGNAIPNGTNWTEISFDWEPTEVNTNWYVRLFILNSDGRYKNEAKVTYAEENATYDILYLDDVKIEEYAVTPLELAGISKNEGYLYSNEQLELEFTKNLSPDQTSAVTVTTADGTVVTPALSVSESVLGISIPDAVQDEVYTITVGTVTALDGETLELNKTVILKADNTTIFYDTFDTGMSKFIESLNPGRAKYVETQNNTEGKTAGAVQLNTYKLTSDSYDNAQYNLSAAYGIDREIGEVEAGKTYEVSAYVKGEPGRYREGFKFAIGVYTPNQINRENAGAVTMTVTDEWQKISYLWTPENNNSTYRVRIHPTSGQKFDGGLESEGKYNIFYIDDVVIGEVPEFEFVGVTPNSGAVLTATDDGITAEFNLQLGAEHTVTVKDSKGNTVASTLTVDGTKLIVAIPNRTHKETYTVSFDSITAANGATITVSETYTYTADETIIDENFDDNMGEFSASLEPNSIAWTASQNHTAGKTSGSVQLSFNGNSVWGEHSQAAYYGVEAKLGEGVKAGRKYLVSAYVKGEAGRIPEDFKFGIGVYNRINKDDSPNATAVVNDEGWTEIYYIWEPDEGIDYSDYYIRIHPVNSQKFTDSTKSADNYNIFYIDDISIIQVGAASNIKVADIAVTYIDGEETVAVTQAADLIGKELTVSLNLANVGGTDQEYMVFAGVYTTSGQLVDIAGAEGTVTTTTPSPVTVTGLDLTEVTESCVMKIFVWDGLVNQSPLTTVQIPF